MVQKFSISYFDLVVSVLQKVEKVDELKKTLMDDHFWISRKSKHLLMLMQCVNVINPAGSSINSEFCEDFSKF